MEQYNKVNWVDHIEDPITGEVIQQGTPLNQTTLGQMDEGIKNVTEKVIKLKASSIPIEDTSKKFASDNVEGALSELFTSASNGKEVIKNAIAGADGSVPIPTNPTFNDLATAIEKISKTKVINGKWEIPDYVQGTWGPVLNPAINYGKTIYFDQFKSVEMLFFKSDKLMSNIGYVDGHIGVYIRNKNGSNYKILLRDNTNNGNISYEFNSSFSVSNNALFLNAPGYLVNYTVVGY